MLAVENIDVYRGRAQILFEAGFNAGRGEAVALVGRNGAGKTTSLQAVMGFLPPLRGVVRIAGEPTTGLPPYRVARHGVGHVPEDRRLFPGLTVAEHFVVPRHRPPEGVERALTLFPALRGLWRRRAGTLSGGEQQMLAVARALTGMPALLLLDEPSEGLAPRVVAALAESLHRLKAEGVTIVLAEQNAGFAARLAERAFVLENGRVAHSGAAGAILGRGGTYTAAATL